MDSIKNYEQLSRMLIEDIQDKLNSKEQIVVAIEGACASGKTTLANSLYNEFDAALVHMDEFFLPRELRSPERYEEAGGNVHYERFKEQVVDRLLSPGELVYQVFNCADMRYDQEKIFEKNELIIYEDSYSMHPYLGHYYELSVYLDIDSEAQISRITLRNGPEKAAIFKDRWIPLEQRYSSCYRISEKADYCFKESLLR